MMLDDYIDIAQEPNHQGSNTHLFRSISLT